MLEELPFSGGILRAEVKIEGGLPREARIQADAPFRCKNESLIARFDGPTRIEALELGYELRLVCEVWYVLQQFMT